MVIREVIQKDWDNDCGLVERPVGVIGWLEGTCVCVCVVSREETEIGPGIEPCGGKRERERNLNLQRERERDLNL